MEAMKNILHMNAGDGKTSYASNSGLQKVLMSKSWSILDETLKYMMFSTGFPKCMKMVDLGCASGPNTLFLISHIMDTVEELFRQTNNVVEDELPEFEVFLNDLPLNDFNNLFKLLPTFFSGKDQKMRKCFISGLPGSFHGRLLPTKTLHFLYSSSSLHWLSQVPEGLENHNKENICMATESPPEVFEAYARQFQMGYFTFLRSRGEEMIPRGCMVLIFVGRSVQDPSSRDDYPCYFSVLAELLREMVDEGQVKEADLHSFNLPYYRPSKQEVEAIIQNEGSFNINKIDDFQVPWDTNNSNLDGDQQNENQSINKYRSGKRFASTTRAFTEPILGSHFGSSINFDDLFERFSKKVGDYIDREKPSIFNLAISLSKK